MGLFLNTSSLHNHYLDCCALDVSETIERDCLSVLHKLHDQVNGLQLVQVVVQPLARLFNPASLAALVSSVPSSSSTVNNASTNVPSSAQSAITVSQTTNHSNVPTSHNQNSGASHHNHDLDGISTTIGSSLTTLGTSSHNSHSRTQSFASNFNISGNSSSNTSSNVINNNNNSLVSGTSTYMMSPDTAQALIARLDTDRDVNWLMEIIGYGLSMPFSLTGEQDSVKDCCTIYCEWLAAALLPYNEFNEDSKYQQLSKLVPVPIRKDPNRYARKMLSHLYNVFLPRQSMAISITNNSHKDQSDAHLTAVSRQAVLCHRVLRTIESIAQSQSNLMDNQTWDHLLALLLTVNDKLLSGPTEPDDIGTQLHDRILGVLFELILLASAKSIPTPGLWKTFHEMSLNWRHRPALVDHWRRITLLLTKRIVLLPSQMVRGNKCQDIETCSQNLEGSNIMNPGAIESAIANMNYEILSQTWYRFLNLIGNPVELSDPNIISRTDEFYHSACASDNVLDPRQHPCLNVLPQIFMNSMTGLRDFVESFLGTYQQLTEERLTTNNEPQTPDKHSHNQSARGSIVSLNSKITSAAPLAQQQVSSAQQAGSQQHSQPQPQALTPTQSRRTGIKSMAMKGGKVQIPFSSSSSSGSHTNALSPPQDCSQQYDHPKSGSVSGSSRQQQQQQFMQPRPSLTSLSSRLSQTQQCQQTSQFKLYAERPKCNSILHIFGDWLFSAALIGSDLNQEVLDSNNDDSNTSESATSLGSTSTTTEVSGIRSYSPSSGNKPTTYRKTSISGRTRSQSSKTQDNIGAGLAEKMMLDPPLSADSFESGQAEAMAILCKIFSSKTSSEDISPTYLSRFYLCLQHCLTFGSGQDQRNNQPASGVIKRQLLASVLISSTTLLQKDLDGINLLIPSFIKAIEFVFECSEREVPIQPPPRQHNRSGSVRYGNASSLNNVTNYDLRRACILTLLNLLAYPFHFKDLVIRNCLNESSPTTTFGSLRPRLLKLLFVALQTETDPTNMQILFGGLSLTIHDLASNAVKATGSSKGSRHKNDSTSSSNIGSDSANNSLETGNHHDETTGQSSFVFNSNGGFIVKSLHVTCHLLINIWKHDTQVSLAALELLTTIARISTSSSLIEKGDQSFGKSSTKVNVNNNNNNRIEMRNEYKQTTKWICDYICNQCSRPPPAHSRDMHSTIVAAYQCLSVWIYSHPYLLDDVDCVTTLMEVIELGVSGQKSKLSNFNSATGITAQQTPISKDEKIMKPSSMRVREAAESLLNICMVRARTPNDSMEKIMASYDTVLDELSIAELFGGSQYKSNLRQIQDLELRRVEAYKLFKYFSDEDSVVFGLFGGSNPDLNFKDSVICLLRTPFGKHCWKMKFNYYTEKSREKIIANKTLGLIKRPFQQCTTPTSESRIFSLPGSQNKSLYFNNTAKFFPETIENLPPNTLDHLVTALDDYIGVQEKDSRIKNDLDKMSKILSHQILAEQKVMSECSIRIKRVDCEEPQPMTDLEAARIVVTHFDLKSSLSTLTTNDRISPTFVNDLKSLDHQSVRTCDWVNIFYVRKNRFNPKEILESVRERHNVSLAFYEWILELGKPTVIKNHNRWTGKLSNSWLNRSIDSSLGDGQDCQTSLSRNQMLTSDHGGAIFDGDRMTLYWSDMCQELAFLVPHKIEKVSVLSSSNSGDNHQQNRQQQASGSNHDLNFNSSTNCSTQSPSGFDNLTKSVQDGVTSHLSTNTNQQDHNLDGQSLCSVTSDSSSQSTRAPSQQSSPRDQLSGSIRDNQKDNSSLSRHSVANPKRKLTNSSTIIGCDTNIIICWLECQDDLSEIPSDTLLSISETGYLLEDENNGYSCILPLRFRDYAKYFISPMKNGLFRVNLITSFGRQWLALPLVDGMTVSKGILANLIRESILNLCRRRRLDADSYQPPHVKRRLKIQDICNSYKISSRYDSTEFYNNLFKSRSS